MAGEGLDVIAVGNLNMDLIGRTERLPTKDEKLLFQEFTISPGGGAANFAVACSRLGLRVGFVGRVGEDEFGLRVLSSLRKEGIDLTQVKTVKAPTGIVFSLSTSRGDHFLVAYRGANKFLSPADIPQRYLAQARLVHASSVERELALAVGSRAKRAGVTRSLDLGAELSVLPKRELHEVFGLFDLCFLNRRAYKQVFRERPTKRGLVKNFPSGLKALAVTLGPRGAMVSDGSQAFWAPSFRVNVKDTTGAGDAFAAAFVEAWLRGAGLKEALRRGLAGAALKIQHTGAREGLPTAEELRRFLNRAMV